MADNLTASQRSFAMSRIRSKGNHSTEMRLVKMLKAAKVTGWRRHGKMAGRPDFVFPRVRVVVFVDGCFWHGCSACFRPPKSNVEYWERKIARNKKRDRDARAKLKATGWRVLRLWEHSLCSPESVLRRIKRTLRVSSSRKMTPPSQGRSVGGRKAASC